MNRFEYLGQEVRDGHRFAIILDTQTGECFERPLRTAPSAVERPRAIPIPNRDETNDPPPGVPRVTLEHHDAAPVKREGNPHAVPNPTYAWQDPDWVDPIVRRQQKRMPPPHQTLGRDVDKIFREPGKFGENEVDHVPGSGRIS